MSEVPSESSQARYQGLEKMVDCYVKLARVGMEDINGGMPRILVGLHGLLTLFRECSLDSLDDAALAEAHQFIAKCATINVSGSPKPPPSALNRLFDPNYSVAGRPKEEDTKKNRDDSQFSLDLFHKVLAGIEPQNRYSTVQAAAHIVYELLRKRVEPTRFSKLESSHNLAIIRQRNRRSLNKHVRSGR